MDPRFQTSFIPKKPIVSQTSSRSASVIPLFPLLATILFIVAILLAGGAFLYQRLLTNQIKSSQATLERAKGAFEPALIDQIVRLDSRIETAKTLLGSHIAITPLFDFISSVTLKSVRFKDFSFAYAAPDKIQVSMTGQAQSYASVALQSDLFNKQKYMKGTVVGDMALDPNGIVTFRVSTIIDSALASYGTSLNKSTQPTPNI